MKPLVYMLLVFSLAACVTKCTGDLLAERMQTVSRMEPIDG